MANINIPEVILVIIESMSCVVRSIGKMFFFFFARAQKRGDEAQLYLTNYICLRLASQQQKEDTRDRAGRFGS